MTNDHKQEIAQYFSRKALNWNRMYSEEDNLTNKFFQVKRRRNVILHFIHRLNRTGTLKILDIGCGSGNIMTDLLQQGYNVIGGDISWQMIRSAQDHSSASISSGSYVQCDVDLLPFRDKAFDVVICAGVLSYLPEIRPGICELCRVLKPGGLLMVTVPNILRINNLFDPYYYVLLGSNFIGHKFFSGRGKNLARSTDPMSSSPIAAKYFYGQLSRLFVANGFCIKTTVSLGFGPLTLWRRQLFSEAFAVRMSNLLERLAARNYLYFLNVFANHWIILLQRVTN